MASAAGIMDNGGTYDSLPVSIFTCKDPPPPPELDDADIARRLEVLIRTKIVMEEQVPASYDSAIMLNGFLVLTCINLFRVTLSLTHLEDSACPWTVISVEILTHNHPHEMLDLDINTEELNSTLQRPLDRLISAPSPPSPDPPLARLYRACKHAALGACLRLLYVQGLDVVRSTWYGYASAVYSDSVEASTLRVQFWKDVVLSAGGGGETMLYAGDKTDRYVVRCDGRVWCVSYELDVSIAYFVSCHV